ncbi:hypothetical protein QJS04_geneDACA021273 [Acorus gramineus]|uniref:Uncharacterized protein n=1 Tax=Acorus gramineus TaxID=55184 RepID=A0AAV9BWK3_ACOGR|nr:hypothetical protein QJS04_geneDACA021273 [Acorus gramineus]
MKCVSLMKRSVVGRNKLPVSRGSMIVSMTVNSLKSKARTTPSHGRIDRRIE